MHEMSLMKGLMRKVDEIASREHAEKVTCVKVWLGALSHFSPAHFKEHFVEVSRGTRAEGAELECTLSQEIDHPHDQDVLIKSLEVEVEDEQ